MYTKSDAAYAFTQAAELCIKDSDRVMIAGPVRVSIVFFYASRRPDLDDTIVCDVLQAQFIGPAANNVVKRRGVIRNDRQIVEKHLYLAVDKLRPRVEILVEELDSWTPTAFSKVADSWEE